MTVRRFGPTLGAGVVVVEKDSGGNIQPAPTGITVMFGQVEKGEDGLNDCSQQSDYVRNCGTYISGSELPNNAFDFFRWGEGAGRLFVVPVRDGTEVASRDVAYSRRTAGGEYYNRSTQANARNVMLTAVAKAGFAAAGQLRSQTGIVTVATDITETTLITGIAALADEWTGAVLALDGVNARSYTVLSNTTAGVITVAPDSTMASDLAAGSDPTNGTYSLLLDNPEREFDAPGSTSGARAAFSLRWIDAEDTTNPGYFGLQILVDGEVIRTYNNLSLDPANQYYLDNVVNEDPDNVWVSFTINYAGTYDADRRPADWYGEFLTYSGNVFTSRQAWVSSVVVVGGTRDVGFVTGFDLNALCPRQVLTLTFTGAAAFDVASTADRGAQAFNQVAGAVDAFYNNDSGDPDNALLPRFIVRDGDDAFAAGDVITITVDPFPTALDGSGGLLSDLNAVMVKQDDNERFSILNNSSDNIALEAFPSVPPTPATSINDDADITDISTAALAFPLAAEGTLVIVSDVFGKKTLTTTAQPYANIAALIAELNAQATAGSMDPFFSVAGTADHVAVDGALYTDGDSGGDSFIRFVDTEANFKVTADTWVLGSAGDEFRIEGARELFDGFDGGDPSDSDYTLAMSSATSVVRELFGRNLGLVKLSVPGVTSTAVQKSLIALAEARNYIARIEMPANTTTEASAVSYINSTIGRSNYMEVAFPSYARVVNPIGDGTIQQSLTGAILGREAAEARDFQGYHKVAAGVDVTFPHVVELPTGDTVLNEEVTNPAGIQVIKRLQGNFVLWGARLPALNPTWRWKQQRELISHYEHVLQENFDFIIFQLNDPTLWAELRATLIAFFMAEWQKRALRGDTFEEAALIKVDSENNTNATIEAGDVNASIALRPAGTVERLVLTVSKRGIFETTS